MPPATSPGRSQGMKWFASGKTRPIHVGLCHVFLEVLVKQVERLLVVLEDQLAVLDLEPLRANGRQAVDARCVTAIAAVRRRILRCAAVETCLVLGAGEKVFRAVIFG